MLGFALFGAGRIGKLHAANLAANSRANLISIYDVIEPAAAELAAKHKASVAPDPESVLADPAIDAVVIGSSTATHVELMTAAAKAGKAVLCEKPIDLDVDRVNRCRDEIAGLDVPIQIGFNRRYDNHHGALKKALDAGEIGALELMVITSRDPGPSTREYHASSGGLFRDMAIHDFDLARFVLGGDEPVEVCATGSVKVEPFFEEIGDIDTAMLWMRTRSGVLCHVNNSRRAVYGYDQRLEVFGSKGMLISNNLRATSVERFTKDSAGKRDPFVNFFLERYGPSYVLELDDFIDAVEGGREPSVTFEDGRRALLLADAAARSLASGKPVRVAE